MMHFSGEASKIYGSNTNPSKKEKPLTCIKAAKQLQKHHLKQKPPAHQIYCTCIICIATPQNNKIYPVAIRKYKLARQIFILLLCP